MSREAVLLITTPGSRSQTLAVWEAARPKSVISSRVPISPEQFPEHIPDLGVSTAQCGTILFGDGNATSDTGCRR